MYIDPVVVGVVGTLLVEVLILLFFAYKNSRK